MSELTAEYLREVLHYDPDTGIFTWKIKPSSRVDIGDRAGSYCNEYVAVRILNRAYYAHRLAWLYTRGCWPKGIIDHINRIKSDNRIANLRDTTTFVNCQNVKPRDSLGVSHDTRSGKWQARIAVNKKRISLGYFPSAQLATEAYLRAKSKLHAS